MVVDFFLFFFIIFDYLRLNETERQKTVVVSSSHGIRKPNPKWDSELGNKKGVKTGAVSCLLSHWLAGWLA